MFIDYYDQKMSGIAPCKKGWCLVLLTITLLIPSEYLIYQRHLLNKRKNNKVVSEGRIYCFKRNGELSLSRRTMKKPKNFGCLRLKQDINQESSKVV